MSLANPDTWWLVLRSLVLLAAFGAFAWALLVSRRDMAVHFAQLTQQNAHALVEIQRLAEQLAELQAQVHDLSLPSPIVSPRPSAPPPAPLASAPLPPHARGYEMAIRMARGGASVEEIATACGMTRSEARLLRQLHYAAHAA
jgi:hypothetical protein